MNLFKKSAIAVIALTLILGTPLMCSCTLPRGYFFQVTSLRGRVVGTNIPFLDSIRWFRQSLTRKDAKLILYDYGDTRVVSDLVAVKSVITDADGKFDFGAIKVGHYTLRIDEEKWPHSDFFDVEVKGRPIQKKLNSSTFPLYLPTVQAAMSSS